MTEPHPMSYFTANELARFPGLGEAVKRTGFEEVQKTAAAKEAAIPEAAERFIASIPRHILNIVDNTFDGTDAQKEALIIGALYSYVPDALEDIARAGYSAETMGVLKEMASYDYSPHASENIARVVVTSATALFKALIPLGQDGEPVEPEHWQSLRHGTEEFENYALPNLNAPKLAALYEQVKQEFLDIAADKPAAQQPKPRKQGGMRP